MKVYKVDLNCDLGESFGRYTLGSDTEVIPLISSANAACGFHASDPLVMDKTVSLVKKAGIQIGAHPGFPDLAGFGRRNMDVTYDEARTMILYQVAALDGFAKSKGLKLQHVKPHGALYNMAAKNYELASAICEGILAYDENLIVMGLSGSELIKAAKNKGLKTAEEVFADRGYEEDGSLVNRRKEGAIITDENIAIERVIGMIKENKVTAITGKDIEIHADTICVHGDGKKALEFVKKIREALKKEDIVVSPLCDIV